MEASTIQFWNAATAAGEKIVPGGTPTPGLHSTYTRTGWASPQYVWQNGVEDWTTADAWVHGCIDQGLVPIILLAECPPPVRGKAGAVAAYLRHVGIAAEHYAHLPVAWQVINEVDDPNAWLGDDPRKAGEVARQAEDIIRAIAPNATVIIGSIQSIWLTGHGYQVWRVFLEGYGRMPRDAAVHCYPEGRSEADITAALQRAWGVLESFGKTGDVGTRLWITEGGFKGFPTMTPEQRADALRAGLRAAEAAGVHHFLHYSFNTKDFGYSDPATAIAEWNAVVTSYKDSAMTTTNTSIDAKSAALERRELAKQLHVAMSWMGFTLADRRQRCKEIIEAIDADYPADGSDPIPAPAAPAAPPAVPAVPVAAPADFPPLQLSQAQAERMFAFFTASHDWPGGEVYSWQDAQAHWKAKGRAEWLTPGSRMSAFRDF